MTVFGKGTDLPRGHRDALREPVTLLASALTKWSTRSVVLTDVSSTGAKLQGRELPSCGEFIVVKFADSVDEFATVVWKEQDECGITFDAPLTPEDVYRLKLHGSVAVVWGIWEPPR